MTTEDVSGQPGVTPDSGASTTNEPASSAPVNEDGGQQTAPVEQQPKDVPFHEHPRFKELIDQNRGYKTQLSDYEKKMQDLQSQYEQRFQQLQSQLQPQQPKFDPNKFLERAKQIDPEFAQTLQWQIEQQRQLENQIQAAQQERMRETAYSKLNSLFDQNKVDQKYRPLYESAIKAAAYENPRFQIKDLDQIFSQFHETFNKLRDDDRREDRKGYVEAKKQDVTPASQTGGGQPPTGKGPDLSTYDKRVAYLASEMRRAKQKI